ncbi:hypothetical protein ACJZ2D_002045 [Fusarium nematophilum]
MTWQTLAEDKKRRINDSIPSEWRVKGDVKADSVMGVPKDSGIMTVNCAHEFFPDIALARAKELDEYYAQHKKTVGPLHGLPISLKDQLRIKGLETTMGYAAWIGKYDEEGSVLTSLLYKAGAVFYIKTSVPQSLMVCETINNIIGRTLNPRNKNWSCGGSSGGEGALVGFRGSVIGVGTDIGGSIRVPSAFNFLYGLRPSHGRLPYANMANSMEGQETVHSVCGPLCHSVEDMRLFVTSVLAEQPWEYDSKVIPMPWRQNEEDVVKAKISSGGLTLGFYECDGVVLPHPPILRGVRTVVEKLQHAGHTVVSWEPLKHGYAVDLLSKVYAADGGSDVFATLKASGEPAIPNFSDLINPSLPKIDMNQLWSTNLEKWAYQREYLAAIRSLEDKLGKELDVIVAPITPTAAIRHDRFKYYGYSSVINLLDFTSVVVPVTFADKKVDVKNDSFSPLTDMDKTVQAEYDAEAYHGAPVAVQIIGRRLTEERVMAIAEEIGKLVGNPSS